RAVRLDEVADLYGVDEMHVELDRCLRLALVGVPGGHAHRAIGERHQHPALHDAAAVVMLLLRREREKVRVAAHTSPERTDEADEALVDVRLPSVRGGIERRWRPIIH